MSATTLFPILQPEAAQEAAELPLCREVAWDYDTNTPVWKQGSPAVVTGKDAVKVWAWKALHTPRFRHEMYSRSYGSELENLIGQPYTEELKRSEAARYIREALSINPYISSVDNISVEFADGQLSISCTITTIYGESEVSTSV
jgi:phage baseplate assembly protein W